MIGSYFVTKHCISYSISFLVHSEIICSQIFGKSCYISLHVELCFVSPIGLSEYLQWLVESNQSDSNTTSEVVSMHSVYVVYVYL